MMRTKRLRILVTVFIRKGVEIKRYLFKDLPKVVVREPRQICGLGFGISYGEKTGPYYLFLH
jgi:hypothetical protein